ncbi:MAG: hypothetical protein ABIU95_09170 [Burkholderiales bacterium]
MEAVALAAASGSVDGATLNAAKGSTPASVLSAALLATNCSNVLWSPSV